MLNASSGGERQEAEDEVVEVDIVDLKTDLGVREYPISYQQIAALREVIDKLPPIVTTQAGDVVDGNHRVEIYRSAKRPRIKTVVVDLTQEEAYFAGVRANLKHGLLLSHPDRRRAAQRLLAVHPDWSHGKVAEAVGLSDKTVAAVRASTPEIPESTSRLGRDGRTRQVPSRTDGKVRQRPIQPEDPEGSTPSRPEDIEPRVTGDGGTKARTVSFKEATKKPRKTLAAVPDSEPGTAARVGAASAAPAGEDDTQPGTSSAVGSERRDPMDSEELSGDGANGTGEAVSVEFVTWISQFHALVTSFVTEADSVAGRVTEDERQLLADHLSRWVHVLLDCQDRVEALME